MTREVTLHMTLQGVSHVAISNTSNFNGAAFVPYAEAMPWTLTAGSEEKTVYIRFRDSKGVTRDAQDSIMYVSLVDDSVKESSDGDTSEKKDGVSCFPAGKAYKSAKESAVYYMTDACTKRPFKQSAVYFTYFDSWDAVTVVEDAVLAAIPQDALSFMPVGPRYIPQSSSLLKTVHDPKVYIIVGEQKYWIADETVFTKLGYKWHWVEDVDERVLNAYTTGVEIIDTSMHPAFTLLKYADGPQVYRIEPNDEGKIWKRYIPSESVFEKLGYRWDRIVTIPLKEVYPDGPDME